MMPIATAADPLSASSRRVSYAEGGGFAGYVGGADVAAAGAADVFAAEDAHEEIAEGDGAQQVAGGGDEEESRHVVKGRASVVFSLRGGTPTLQPARRRRYFRIELRQLCVFRSFRGQLALVQKELAGRHGTKLWRGQGGEFFLQVLEDAVGARLLLLRRGEPERASAARQREVRAEGAVFFRNSERGHFVVDRRGQRRELRSRLPCQSRIRARISRWGRIRSRGSEFRVRSASIVDSACLICSTAGSGCSPMNFRVTWRDSGLAQRASGANPLTPSTKRAMRSRMASAMSRAMKRRMGVALGLLAIGFSGLAKSFIACWAKA